MAGVAGVFPVAGVAEVAGVSLVAGVAGVSPVAEVAGVARGFPGGRGGDLAGAHRATPVGVAAVWAAA